MCFIKQHPTDQNRSKHQSEGAEASIPFVFRVSYLRLSWQTCQWRTWPQTVIFCCHFLNQTVGHSQTETKTFSPVSTGVLSMECCPPRQPKSEKTNESVILILRSLYSSSEIRKLQWRKSDSYLFCVRIRSGSARRETYSWRCWFSVRASMMHWKTEDPCWNGDMSQTRCRDLGSAICILSSLSSLKIRLKTRTLSLCLRFVLGADGVQ